LENWLSINKRLFKNPSLRHLFKRTARYWLKNGKHNPAFIGGKILSAQKLWDDFIKDYVELQPIPEPYL
jgi:hypothetical protein